MIYQVHKEESGLSMPPYRFLRQHESPHVLYNRSVGGTIIVMLPDETLVILCFGIMYYRELQHCVYVPYHTQSLRRSSFGGLRSIPCSLHESMNLTKPHHHNRFIVMKEVHYCNMARRRIFLAPCKSLNLVEEGIRLQYLIIGTGVQYSTNCL